MRNVLKNFEICSQLARSFVELNRPVHKVFKGSLISVLLEPMTFVFQTHSLQISVGLCDYYPTSAISHSAITGFEHFLPSNQSH